MSIEHDTARISSRLSARVAALVLVAVVLSPLVTGHDSYPLSTYPMYAFVRPREQTFDRVIAIERDGTERRLSMATIASTDDPLVAEQRVRDAVARGGADALCAQVAARAPSGVASVLVVRERHDVVSVATGESEPLSRTVVARCSAGG